MSGTTVGTTLNYGYQGGVSRAEPYSVLAKPVKSTSGNIKFGVPVILDATNTVVDCGTTTITATNFFGVSVAEVKTNLTFPVGQDTAQSAYYAPSQMCDVLQEGVIIVHISRGTSINAGGGVYVRKTLSTALPNSKVGDFETSADGSNTVLLTNAVWYSNTIDANGNAELKLLKPVI